LLNRVAELQQQEIDRAGRHGALGRALDSMAAHDRPARARSTVERQYRAALRLRKMKKSDKA
jgi:hypothetical protein